MSEEIDIIGSFDGEHECAAAVEALRGAGLHAMRAFTPFPCEHLSQALAKPRSWVRLFVLLGGIAGAVTGFGMCIYLSLDWPLVVGGKPLISIPPFTIIAFELMILFGAISALLSFLFIGRFPNLREFPGYSTRFGSDQVGLVVRCGTADAGLAERLMLEAGADEVKRGAA